MTEAEAINSEPKPNRRFTVLCWISIVNLVGVVCLLVLIFAVSESWWPGVVATYFPRGLCIIPALILLAFSLRHQRFPALLNALALVLVIFVAMEFKVPAFGPNGSDAGQDIRVVTCNVNDFKPDFKAVFDELTATDLDLVVFQEAYREEPEILTSHFKDWHVVSLGQYWIASRFPIQEVGRCFSPEFNHLSAVAVQVDAPECPFVLVALHTSTARFGLRHLLNPGELASGEAVSGLNAHQSKRETEMAMLAEFVKGLNQNQAVVLAGDFNTPASSKLFKDSWSDYFNAFSAGSWGFGYTAPCQGTPVAGWPWARVDHILVDDSWTVTESAVGSSNGSDHRLVSATIRNRSGTN